ncbi:MAG: hypothetical protein QFX12_04925 [Rickettsia africae]|uniref:Lipopolysaccharide-assembly family protein n=3 Tax=spotted fever group TaxID=114277 RepID=C4K108_RICPU|nr:MULTISPECIES: hypothetical protein [spotted fever group]ACP53190.1 Unknown [Rickettsia africae ESF-5]ACR47259.1 hypothetical protein RPR_02035 [Rickettsia peacockii str. Rustic]AFC74439.1 hypothetical protein MC1_01345 [Rickettsia parkeri str. Portsmouth]KJV94035.1 lipopolysaccharide-assembly family protein [Rickettsia parkeri str. Grand Bay]
MRSLFVIIIFFLMSSCNLKPVYSEKYSRNNDLEAIEVEPIRTIEGAEFYHRLTSILPQKAQAKYLLKVKLIATTMPATIEKNSNVLREYINQLVRYKLIDIESQKVLIEEKFYQNTSYNAIFTPYATNVERDKTGIDLAYQAAEEIRSRLILYFTRK